MIPLKCTGLFFSSVYFMGIISKYMNALIRHAFGVTDEGCVFSDKDGIEAIGQVNITRHRAGGPVSRPYSPSLGGRVERRICSLA